MVRHEQDQGVVGLPRCLQGIEHFAEQGVFQRAVGPVVSHRVPHLVRGQLIPQLPALPPVYGRLVAQTVAIALRQLDAGRVVQVPVAPGDVEGIVRSDGANPQHPRGVLAGGLVAQPIHGPADNPIVREAFVGLVARILQGSVHLEIPPARTLNMARCPWRKFLFVSQTRPPVHILGPGPAGRLDRCGGSEFVPTPIRRGLAGGHMPFAAKRHAVSALPQSLRECFHAFVQAVVDGSGGVDVVVDPVSARIEAGEEGGARRTAVRGRGIRRRERDAFGRKPFRPGRDAGVIRRDHVGLFLIRHEHEDVGAHEQTSPDWNRKGLWQPIPTAMDWPRGKARTQTRVRRPGRTPSLPGSGMGLGQSIPQLAGPECR